MSAWSHLPNAAHIDWVFQTLRSHPEVWIIADSAWWSSAGGAAYATAYDAAWDMASDEVRFANRHVAWDAAWDSARGGPRDAAWDSARDAILALIAYDDASKYLDMTTDQLKVWIALSSEPGAVLVLPMIHVKEQLNEQSLVRPS